MNYIYIFTKRGWLTILIAFMLVVVTFSCSKEKAINPTSPSNTSSLVTRAFITAHPWRIYRIESDRPLDSNSDSIFNTNINLEMDTCDFKWYYVYRTDSLWEEHIDNVPCGGPYSETWAWWYWMSPTHDSIQMTEGPMLVTKLTMDTLIVRYLSWESSIDTTATITIKYVTGP